MSGLKAEDSGAVASMAESIVSERGQNGPPNSGKDPKSKKLSKSGFRKRTPGVDLSIASDHLQRLAWGPTDIQSRRIVETKQSKCSQVNSQNPHIRQDRERSAEKKTKEYECEWEAKSKEMQNQVAELTEELERVRRGEERAKQQVAQLKTERNKWAEIAKQYPDERGECGRNLQTRIKELETRRHKFSQEMQEIMVQKQKQDQESEEEKAAMREYIEKLVEELDRQAELGAELFNKVRAMANKLDIQSEQDIMSNFETLCYKIKGWCAEFSWRYEAHYMKPGDLKHLRETLDLDRDLDPHHLKPRLSRLYLIQSFIWHLLISQVFYNGDNDMAVVKDLWTSQDAANELRVIEARMLEIDIPVEDLNKWRCMTIRLLSGDSVRANYRGSEIVEEVLPIFQAIFGLQGGDSSKAKKRLEEVVAEAIDLSLSLRRQLSTIWVRNDSKQLNPTTVYSEDTDTTEQVKVMIRPALVRATNEFGVWISEEVILSSSETVLLPTCENEEREPPAPVAEDNGTQALFDEGNPFPVSNPPPGRFSARWILEKVLPGSAKV